MKEKKIKISDDFTRFPSGRYKTDGEFTGEHFREDFLVPYLKENDKVVIDINDVRGYGSSFLEEAFGGLVRNKYFSENDLKKRMTILCSENNNTYKDEIWLYIKEAQNELV